MPLASVNFQHCRNIRFSLQHSTRAIVPNYVLEQGGKGISCRFLNSSRQEVEERFFAKMALRSPSGVRQNSSVYAEGVINLADEPEAVLWEKLTTWKTAYEGAVPGHKVLFIALHRDEGKIKDLEADDDPAHLDGEWQSFEYIEADGVRTLKKIKYNIHAHVVIDRTTKDPTTGQQRIITLDKKKLREIQNFTAQATGLGRGRSAQETGNAHLRPQEYKRALAIGEGLLKGKRARLSLEKRLLAEIKISPEDQQAQREKLLSVYQITDADKQAAAQTKAAELEALKAISAEDRLVAMASRQSALNLLSAIDEEDKKKAQKAKAAKLAMLAALTKEEEEQALASKEAERQRLSTPSLIEKQAAEATKQAAILALSIPDEPSKATAVALKSKTLQDLATPTPKEVQTALVNKTKQLLLLKTEIEVEKNTAEVLKNYRNLQRAAGLVENREGKIIIPKNIIAEAMVAYAATFGKEQLDLASQIHQQQEQRKTLIQNTPSRGRTL